VVRDRHLPRLAAHLAILDVLLVLSAAWVYRNHYRFTAVRTLHRRFHISGAVAKRKLAIELGFQLRIDLVVLVVSELHRYKLERVSKAPQARKYDDSDWNEWLRMSLALFPEQSADEAARGMREWLARDDTAVFISERGDGTACGYVEVGSRPYADGCDTSPVGYVEAWYVDPDARRQGHGRALLGAAEEWARARGYREIASDTQLDNEMSREAHVRSGYEEVDRVIQFRKPLA